jgi:hypothetical protein
MPAPFLLLGGCSDPPLIRAIFDFHSWVKMSGLDPEGVLNDSFRVVEHHLKGDQEENPGKSDTVHYKLPLGYPNMQKHVLSVQGLQTQSWVLSPALKRPKN